MKLVTLSVLGFLLSSSVFAAAGTPIPLAYWNFENSPQSTTLVPADIKEPGIKADLATSADRFNEPEGFYNGVTDTNFFEPNNHAFIIHNAGRNLTFNQRNVGMKVTADNSWTLSGIQIRAQTNAMTGPLTVAVEWSSNSFFTFTRKLGEFTVQGGDVGWTIQQINAELPAGTSYLRFRNMTPIPDGSNYIAYDDIHLIGFLNKRSDSSDCSINLACSLSVSNWECRDTKGRVGRGDNSCKAQLQLRELACNAGEDFSYNALNCTELPLF